MDSGPRDSVEDRINRFRQADPASRSDRFRVNEIRPLHYDQSNTFELSALDRSDGYQAPSNGALQQTLGGGTRDFATGNFQDRYPSMNFEESGRTGGGQGPLDTRSGASLQAGDTRGGHYGSGGQASMMNTLHGNTNTYSVRNSTGSEKSFGLTGNFNQRYPSMQLDDDGDKELDILTTADSFELRARDDNAPYKSNGSGSDDISASAYPRKVSTMPTPAPADKGDYSKYNTIVIDNDNNIEYIKGRLMDQKETESRFDPTRERDSHVRPAFPILNQKQKDAHSSESSNRIASQDLKSLKKDLLSGSAMTTSRDNVQALQTNDGNRSLIEALLDGGEGYQRNMKAALTYSPSTDAAGNATMSSTMNSFALGGQKNATMPTMRGNIPNSFPIKTPDISPHTSVNLNIAGGDRRLFDSPGARPEAIIGQDPSTGRFNWTGRSVASNDGSVDGLMLSEYAYKKSGGTYRGPKYGTDILDSRPAKRDDTEQAKVNAAATHGGRSNMAIGEENPLRRPSLGTSLDQWKMRLSHPPPTDGASNTTEATEKKGEAPKSPISPERMQKLSSLPWYRSSVDSQASTQPESDSEVNIGTAAIPVSASIHEASTAIAKPPAVESGLPPSPDLASLSMRKGKEGESAHGAVAVSSDSLKLNLDISPAATDSLRPPQIPTGTPRDSTDMLKLRGVKGSNGKQGDLAASDQSIDLLEIRKELLAIDKKGKSPSQSQDGALPLKIDGKTLNTAEIDKMLMEESGWMHTQEGTISELGEVNANVTSLIADMRAKDKAIQQSLLQQSHGQAFDKNILNPGEVKARSHYHDDSITANKDGSNTDNHGTSGKGLQGYQEGDISLLNASPSVQNLFKSSHIIELEHTLDGITVKADELMRLKRDALETVHDVEKVRADQWVKKQARYHEEFDMIQEYISTQQNTQAQYGYKRNRTAGGGSGGDKGQEGSALDDDSVLPSFVNHSLNEQGLHTLHSIERDVQEEHRINKTKWLHKDLDALHTTLGPAQDGLMTFADGGMWEGVATRAGSVARQADPMRVFKDYHMFPEAGNEAVPEGNPFDTYVRMDASYLNWREFEYLQYHNALGDAQKEQLLTRLKEHGSVPADGETKGDKKDETTDAKSNYYSYISASGDKGKELKDIDDQNADVEGELANGITDHTIIPVNSDKSKYPWMGLTEADQQNPFSQYAASKEGGEPIKKESASGAALPNRFPTSIPGMSTSSRARGAPKDDDAIRESVYGSLSDMISSTNTATSTSHITKSDHAHSRILLGSRKEKSSHSRAEKEALKQRQAEQGGFKLVIGSKGEGSEHHAATHDHPRQGRKTSESQEKEKEKKYGIEFEAPGIEQRAPKGPIDKEMNKAKDVTRVVELLQGMGFESSTARTLPSQPVVNKSEAPAGGNGDAPEVVDSHWRKWSSPAQSLDLDSLKKGGEDKVRSLPPEDVTRVLELLQGIGLTPPVSSSAKPDIEEATITKSEVVPEQVDTAWRKWAALTASLDLSDREKEKKEGEDKVRSPEQQEDVGRVLELLKAVRETNITSTSLASAPPMDKTEASASEKGEVSEAKWLKWSASPAPVKPKEQQAATVDAPSFSDGLKENGYLPEAVAKRIVANMLGQAPAKEAGAGSDLRPQKRSNYLAMFNTQPASPKKEEKPAAPFSTRSNSIMSALDYRIYPSPNAPHGMAASQKTVAPTYSPRPAAGVPRRGSNVLPQVEDGEVRVDLRTFAGGGAGGGQPSSSGPMYSPSSGRDPFSVLKAGTTAGAPVMEKENYLQTSRHLRQQLMGQYRL